MAARKKFKLKGVDEFMKALTKEVHELKGRTLKGMLEGAIVIQRAAEPGTPIDVGNLRSSWFTISYRTQGDLSKGKPKPRPKTPEQRAQTAKVQAEHKTTVGAVQGGVSSIGNETHPVVAFGYSANYAAFVHEKIDAKFKRPKAHARWLYKAMQGSRAEVLEAIRKEASFK